MEYKTCLSEKDTDGRNIANLCVMCGQCCLAIATEYTHEQLIEMAKKGEKEAGVFVGFFKKYENLDAARKVAAEHVKQVLKYKGYPDDYSGDDVSFYYCEKIAADKSCTVHSERPLCCRMAPGDGWSLMPPKCGYVGWQYESRERTQGNIRAIKEKLYEVEFLDGPDAFVKELNMSVQEVKKYIEEKSKPFKKYGSKGW